MSHSFKVLAFGFVTIMMSASAFAGGTVGSAGDDVFQECLQHAQSDVAMGQCSDAELQRLNGILNSTYRDLYVQTTKADASQGNTGSDTISSRLIKAQNSWVSYKDATCVLEAGTFFGGSGEVNATTDCLIQQTKLRINQLNDLKKSFTPYP